MNGNNELLAKLKAVQHDLSEEALSLIIRRNKFDISETITILVMALRYVL